MPRDRFCSTESAKVGLYYCFLDVYNIFTCTRGIFLNAAACNARGFSSSGKDDEEPATSSSTAMERLVNEVCNLRTVIESQSSQVGDVAGNMQTVASSLERENLVRR